MGTIIRVVRRWMVIFALVATGDCVSPAAQPVRKDTSLASRPKNAGLTLWVVQREVRRGKNVTYVVKSKLDQNCYMLIYGSVDAARKDKLAYTRFDFFDTGGLKLERDWSTLEGGGITVLPLLGDQPVPVHEKEVNWTISLIVPAGIKPGKKTLRCQAFYQIIDLQKVSAPGRWTLPDVVVTIKE